MSAVVTQCNPYIEMQTPFGPGRCHFMIYEGPEADLKWVVFLEKRGRIVVTPNPKARGVRNWTYFQNEIDLPGIETAPWEQPHILDTQKPKAKRRRGKNERI